MARPDCSHIPSIGCELTQSAIHSTYATRAVPLGNGWVEGKTVRRLGSASVPSLTNAARYSLRFLISSCLLLHTSLSNAELSLYALHSCVAFLFVVIGYSICVLFVIFSAKMLGLFALPQDEYAFFSSFFFIIGTLNKYLSMHWMSYADIRFYRAWQRQRRQSILFNGSFFFPSFLYLCDFFPCSCRCYAHSIIRHV